MEKAKEAKEMKTVCQYASRDQNYLNLQTFHYGPSGHVIGTDGFRLYATKEPYELERANKTFMVKDFEAKGEFVELVDSKKYPNINLVVPNTYSCKVKITIPSWFAQFNDGEQVDIFTLDYSERDLPKLIVGNCSNERSIVFKASLLAPLAGREVSLLITSPLSPTVITSKNLEIEEYCENLQDELYKEEWFALLMPFRVDMKTSTDNKVHV